MILLLRAASWGCVAVAAFCASACAAYFVTGAGPASWVGFAWSALTFGILASAFRAMADTEKIRRRMARMMAAIDEATAAGDWGRAAELLREWDAAIEARKGKP